MTYEEKKEWLRRYRKAAKLEKIKLEEVERYRTDAEHMYLGERFDEVEAEFMSLRRRK